MKQKKGFLVTLVVVFGLGVWTFFELREEKKNLDERQQKVRLFSMKLDHVDHIEIQHPQEKEVSIILKRDLDGWSLLEPVRDIASNTEVENFLNEILSDAAVDVVKESPEINWSQYKLEEPLAIFKLQNHQGQQEQLAVSSLTNFEGQNYGRKNSENRLLVLNAAWKGRANETNIRFRERKLFRGPLSAVQQIDISGVESSPLRLKKLDQTWSVVGDTEKIEQNKVREWLTQISESSISNYLVNDKPSQKDRAQWGLQKPKIDISLKTHDREWRFELNQAKDFETYAVVTTLPKGPHFLVKLEPGQWEKFANLKKASLKLEKTP